MEAIAFGNLPDLGPGDIQVQHAGGLGGLRTQRHVLGHGEDRDQHEVLVHHADARGHRVARAAELHRLVVDQDLPLGGLVEPVEHVHQCGFAGAILAEQAVDLPVIDHQVYALVGIEGTEGLGDSPQFEFHDPTIFGCLGSGWTQSWSAPAAHRSGGERWHAP